MNRVFPTTPPRSDQTGSHQPRWRPCSWVPAGPPAVTVRNDPRQLPLPLPATNSDREDGHVR